jgi:hypothetical protein
VDRELAGVGGGQAAQPILEAAVAGAQHDPAHAARDHRRGLFGDQVDALLGREARDRGRDRRGRVDPQAVLVGQRRAALGLAGQRSPIAKRAGNAGSVRGSQAASSMPLMMPTTRSTSWARNPSRPSPRSGVRISRA